MSKTNGLSVLATILLLWPLAAAAQDSELTFDNLERVEGAEVAMAYIDPEADFGVYRRVALLEPHVAFRANWQRDQRRTRGSRPSAADMDRIRADAAALFQEVFTERLEAAGYLITDQADYDVLVLRPAIIDLDISVPDTRTGGRRTEFAATAGAATLYVQLFDAVTGEIIGRAADRRTTRNRSGTTLMWQNRVTNLDEGRRMFGVWADRLVAFLDQHYTPHGSNLTPAETSGAPQAPVDFDVN